MRYQKYDFAGGELLRAYMIGFRIGDLNVYKTSEKSELIVVRCHTTQKEQVDVIKKLFQKFGKVTISVRNGHFHANCFLNQTFHFLIPKDFSDVSRKGFPAFVAGYTDAEGNFILNQNRARFKIDSYDFHVLNSITEWLHVKGIQYKLRQIARKGDLQYIRGVKSKYNGDLWRLNINQAKSLKKFITKIIPFLKHRKRIKDARISLENIISRE